MAGSARVIVSLPPPRPRAVALVPSAESREQPLHPLSEGRQVLRLRREVADALEEYELLRAGKTIVEALAQLERRPPIVRPVDEQDRAALEVLRLRRRW